MTKDLMALYQQEYLKLNEAQQEAVNTIYGQVMVLAGPGTGKTQILALRIANLLLSEAQINPNEILCITFTDAGRIAMRTRLNKIVGPEVAQRINIHTFHSFCNDIIQSNKLMFDKDILEHASELEQINIIKKVIQELPTNHLLRNPKNPYQYAKTILDLFNKMKKENWSAAHIHQKIEEYIDIDMPGEELRDTFFYKTKAKAGEPKPKYFEELKSLDKTKAAADLYQVYLDKMFESNRYDYQDMILWIVRAFKEDNNFRLRYAEQFQFLLVDEYQDTNGSQNELIHTLCQDAEDPNLFVVGDDDQSIFRFQGASVANMNTLRVKYPNIKIITLTHNYRSYQEILNTAHGLIEKNNDRLKASASPLIAFNGSHSIARPHIHKFLSARHEMIWLAQQIEQLIHSGVKANEIAVLFRNNKDCLKLGEYLKCIHIDFYTKSRLNLLAIPLVKKLLRIMEYVKLENELPFSGDGILFEILHYDFFELNSFEIAKASLLSSREIKRGENKTKTFREYLNDWINRHTPELFVERPEDKILKTQRKLEELIAAANNLELLPFFKKLVQSCNIYPYLIKSDDKIALIDELTALFTFIEEEAHLNPNLNLASFMSVLDMMLENDLDVAYNKSFGKEDAVQLLTIHGSKGLEFEHVFIAGCIADEWENKRPNYSGSFKLPKRVVPDYITHNPVEDEQQENRRLLFVAITRAKKSIDISFYGVKNNSHKEVAPSAFLYEIFSDDEIMQATNNTISESDFIRFEPVHITSEGQPLLKKLEKEYIDKQLEGFIMNVSALNNYLKCPLHFYFNNILKVPSGLTENASFGSAVHTALESLFVEMKKRNDTFPDLDYFITAFKKDMFKRKETFTIEKYKELMAYGEGILKLLYENNVFTWNKITKTEYSPQNIKWNGIPLKGFMDKLEFTGKHVNIVDYKTGKFDGDYAKNNLKTPDKTKDGKGGNYWRQAVFYKMLLDYDKTNDWIFDSVEFVFVEPKKPEMEFYNHKFSVSDNDLHIVQEQITQTWENIHNHNFYKGCGDEKCEWCNFVKENNLYESLEKVMPESE